MINIFQHVTSNSRKSIPGTGSPWLSFSGDRSWPSSSRKYSATVKPVSATRARAPGGSFIWPYTRAACRPHIELLIWPFTIWKIWYCQNCLFINRWFWKLYKYISYVNKTTNQWVWLPAMGWRLGSRRFVFPGIRMEEPFRNRWGIWAKFTVKWTDDKF